MREVLRELIAAKEPRTLADLCESEKLRDTCDRVTVFRLLGRLVEKGSFEGSDFMSEQLIMYFPIQMSVMIFLSVQIVVKLNL